MSRAKFGQLKLHSSAHCVLNDKTIAVNSCDSRLAIFVDLETPTRQRSAGVTSWIFFPFATQHDFYQKNIWTMLGDSTEHCVLNFVAIEQELSEKIKSVRMRGMSEGRVKDSTAR